MLKDFPLLRGLPDAEADAIAGAARVRTYRRGETILRAGIDMGRFPMPPAHSGGITVVRANGSCGRAGLNVYRSGNNLQEKLELLDEM